MTRKRLEEITTQDEKLMKIGREIFKPIMKGHVLRDIVLRKNKGYEKIHFEIPESTKKTMLNENISKLYAGIHFSFWETTGFLVSMNHYGFNVPYIVMGSNLAPNKKVIDLSKRLGVIIHERTKRSVKDLEENIKQCLINKNDIFIFPGGGRTYNGIPKKFKPTAFSGAIKASNEWKIAIVNVAFTYKRVREDKYLIKNRDKKAQKLRLNTMLEFLKPMDDIYISFSEPYFVDPKDDRKDIAKENFNMALNEIKIVPNHILSASSYDIEKAKEIIEINYDKIRGFNEFNIEFMAEETIKNAHKDFRDQRLREYYMNQIKHYLD